MKDMDYSDLSKLENTALASPPPKKRVHSFLGSAAIVMVLFGLFMLVGPAGRVPLMDANRVLLAETASEGYCAAPAHFKGWPQESYDSCLESSAWSDEINIRAVLPAFCQGVIEQGWPGTVPECQQIAEQNQLWPTKVLTTRGWLSNSWNKAFPYPGSYAGIGTQRPDNSRTGERDGNLRDGEIDR